MTTPHTPATLAALLGVAVPIIQAPMAGVQDAALAAAVSNAGGLGSLPCAMLSPDALDTELQRLRDLTDKPCNVNFFCHTLPRVSREDEALWLQTLSGYFAELKLEPPAESSSLLRKPFGEVSTSSREFSLRPARPAGHRAHKTLGRYCAELRDNRRGGTMARCTRR